MVENTDLDLAIALALSEGNEPLSDDDFKPTKRSVKRNQHILFRAQKNTPGVHKGYKLKKNFDQQEACPLRAKKCNTENCLDDDASEGASHRLRTSKENNGGALTNVRCAHPNNQGVVQHSTFVSAAEFDRFRFKGTQGQVPTGGEIQASVAAGRTNLADDTCHFKSNAEVFPQNPPAKVGPEDCLVIDIDTEEIELSDESQFNLFLRLCDEETLPEELDSDSRDVGPVLQPVLPSTACEISDGSQSPSLVAHGNTPNVHQIVPPVGTAKTVSPTSTANDVDTADLSELAGEIKVAKLAGNDKADEILRQQEVVAEATASVNTLDEDEENTDEISAMMTQTRAAPLDEEVSCTSCSKSHDIGSHTGHSKFERQIGVYSEQAIDKVSYTCIAAKDVTGSNGQMAMLGNCILNQQSALSDGIDNCLENEIARGSLGYTIAVEKPPAVSQIMKPTFSCESPQPVTELVKVENEQERIRCPVCGFDISESTIEERVTHANVCLETYGRTQECSDEKDLKNSPPFVPASDRIRSWLASLSLSKYAHLFEQQEIDWDTLQWLTEQDLFVMGIVAVGPRRKILGALHDLKCGIKEHKTELVGVQGAQNPALDGATMNAQVQIPAAHKETRILPRTTDSSRHITNYFLRPQDRSLKGDAGVLRSSLRGSVPGTNGIVVDRHKAAKRPRAAVNLNTRGIPAWMCIPGTPFRVDAFQHLSSDCSHWFLTHFHTDHYHGLTRGFRYGQIFCSRITARLVNSRIGVSWDKLMIVPLNEKFRIAEVDVTFIDANHCPGSVMILFEPPNGEAVLHTGDFRFCTEMAENSSLKNAHIRTLVLDTTFCDSQYDFPSQATVIRFVIDAIQAELFNSGTLFLIGTYTVGKERLFLEVAKALQKYVYVGTAKKKLLDLMDLPADDAKWLTCNEHESFIHTVPLWSISSFKRMSSIAKHYQDRYKVIVAFSPSGWNFGKGKKKTPGKRWQQGTMIRYEVPYSEHCSFSELREFLKFIAPDDIIPSVPSKVYKDGDQMIASLWNEDESLLPQPVNN